jgi:type 1 fimbriae regulatory protein FimB/type 1 fimbriae regulatory protein FimE
LMEAANGNRYGHRDATMVLVAYRHGLRAAELSTCGGTRSTSIRPPWPSGGPRRGRRPPIRSAATNCAPCAGYSASKNPDPHLCSRPSAGHLSAPQALPAWSSVRGRRRSSASRRIRICCGFALANKGHDTRALQAYLGHKNIQHTVRYTELAPDRFKDFWR